MSKKMEAKELDSLEVDGIGLITPGIQLEHPVFGLGQVETIFKFVKSDDITICINFDKHGSKTLVPKYANLSLPKTKKQRVSPLSMLFGWGR